MSVPTTNAQEQILRNDPEAAYREMLHRLNINPDMGGAFGQFLQRRIRSLLAGRIAATGTAQSPFATVDSAINEFNNGLITKTPAPSTWWANMTNASNQAAQNPTLRVIPDQNQVAQQLLSLAPGRSSFLAPELQRTIGNQMGNTLNQYADMEYALRGQGQSPPLLVDWLRSKGRSSLFGV